MYHSCLLKAIHKFNALSTICFVTDHVLLRHSNYVLYPENCKEAKEGEKAINFLTLCLGFDRVICLVLIRPM